MEPQLAPLAERLESLGEELAREDEDLGEGWKGLEELSEELTKKVEELERSGFSHLFDERGTSETLEDSMERLSRGNSPFPKPGSSFSISSPPRR